MKADTHGPPLPTSGNMDLLSLLGMSSSGAAPLSPSTTEPCPVRAFSGSISAVSTIHTDHSRQ